MMLFASSCLRNSRFSPRSLRASIAFLIRISIRSSESGFSKKSNAPSLVARTAVSMVPCPEMMITSGGSSCSLIFSSVSSPSIPGSQISRRTRSYERVFSVSRQASPLSATPTLKPSSSSAPRSDLRMSASSSTTRMEFMAKEEFYKAKS